MLREVLGHLVLSPKNIILVIIQLVKIKANSIKVIHGNYSEMANDNDMLILLDC